MRRFLGVYGLYLAWLVAVVATAGSISFSETRLFVPCTLCWCQRILMYPLVIVLGQAAFRRSSVAVPYVLPFSFVGAGVALFCYLEQNVPGFGAPAICRSGVACSTQYIDVFGFVAIPFLAVVATVLITLLLVGAHRGARS